MRAAWTLRGTSGAPWYAALLGAVTPAAAGPNPNAPYRDDADARHDLAEARERAASAHHLVMVIFGGNWCPDCVVLHRSLETGATHVYASQHFEFVAVNIGRFDRNLDLANELGVTLKKGVPAAVILEADGTVIGRTMNGELEASRNYTPAQILGFMQDVVEKHTVAFPNRR